MKLKQLQSQLDELKKKEAVAQTKEQLLNEEKDLLLTEATQLLNSIKALKIVSEKDATPNNLVDVIDQVERYIDAEIAKSTIPQELL